MPGDGRLQSEHEEVPIGIGERVRVPLLYVLERSTRKRCRESRDDDGLVSLSVLSHSRAKEGKNSNAKHARWKEMPRQDTDRVKQRLATVE